MGKDLSDDQVSSMKEAFTLFDTDDDDKITPSELGILMRSLGGNPTQAQLKTIIAEEKLNSPFDFNRFLDLMSKHKLCNSMEDLDLSALQLRWFRGIDWDRIY
ncbi:hypothetical protein L1987_30950 [Smallanthus sonchifolius]|uniref:Uncharacterized protein n=1 Tax=Smallanthus sonchifolius TaxID=185202 RepID=A0ACB9I413_9ASTR|nr:hypothetical protein L1987_30950 [Smallanthus sonchifolius]